MAVARLPGSYFYIRNEAQTGAGLGLAIAATVGASTRGPSFEVVPLANTKNLFDIFGQRDLSVGFGVSAAFDILRQAQLMLFTRVVGADAAFSKSEVLDITPP